MRGLIAWLAPVVAVGCFSALAAYSYPRYQPYRHEDKDYSKQQVGNVDELIKPELLRPKSAKERARIIANLWNLKAGSLEIGRLN